MLDLRAFAPPGKGGEVTDLLVRRPGTRHVVRAGVASGTDEELVTAEIDPDVGQQPLATARRGEHVSQWASSAATLASSPAATP